MAQARNRQRGRPPARPLQLTSNFETRLHAVECQGVTFRQIIRSVDVCGPRTLFNIRAGVARCTPTALCAVAIVAEILGGLRRDLIVRGALIDPPPVDLTIRALKKLASSGPQTRAFADRRMEQLTQERQR